MEANVFTERVERLIARLRTTFWQKQYESFHDGPDAYCILGAITKAYEIETGKQVYHGYQQPGSSSALLPEVQEYYGFKSSSPMIDGKPIYVINDKTKKGLRSLAKMIQDNADKLFQHVPTFEKVKAVVEEKRITLAEFFGLKPGEKLPEPKREAVPAGQVFKDAWLQDKKN